MILILSSWLGAQSRSASRSTTGHPSADQLGMTCEQILDMSSTDWVTRFTSEKGSSSAETTRAIGVYGKCYDTRTDQLAAKLGRAGKRPLMGARGNFQSMEQALKIFTARALTESQPPADPVKSAYATLYEKQFRYEFYEAFEPKPATPATSPAASSSSKQAPPSAASGQKSPASDASASRGANSSGDASNNNAKGGDVDPLTAAKNHFGELLGNLPDQQMHDLHESFGEILGPNSASPKMQLLVYRYAIFLLEPPGGTPFSLPPF